MMIVSEILALLFAIFQADHDAVAVNKFRDFGVSKLEQAQFHEANVFMRLIFIGGVSVFILFPPTFFLLEHLGEAALTACLDLLIIWIVFDPALNLFRHPKQPWDYLGEAGTDKWLLSHMGKHAGKIKFFLGLAIVLIINVLYFL